MTTNQPTRQYRYRIEHMSSRVSTFTAWSNTRDEAYDAFCDAAEYPVQIGLDIRIIFQERPAPAPRPFFLRREIRP